MIAYIKGEITFRTPTFVIIETAGVGYHVNISLQTYAIIEKQERSKLLTHLHIKEDSHTLYGFANDAERGIFRHLISVSGIGPNTAQVLLSSMNSEDVKVAIISEDVNAFKRVKGIGPKTAKRIILDLKDKMLKDGGDTPLSLPTTGANNATRQEALSAMIALGFNRIQVQKTLNQILKTQPNIDSVEMLIKEALKRLSG